MFHGEEYGELHSFMNTYNHAWVVIHTLRIQHNVIFVICVDGELDFLMPSLHSFIRCNITCTLTKPFGKIVKISGFW